MKRYPDYYFTYFSTKLYCGYQYLLELPQLDNSNVYPQSMFHGKTRNNTFWLGMKAFYMYIEIDKYFSYHSSETYVVGYSLEGPR